MALTDEQLSVQQQTGIPDERFDPSFWKGRTAGNRPPDKIIWQTWTPQQRAEAGYPDFAAYQAAAQAWRGRFSEGGDIWKKHRLQEASILQNRPQTEAQLKALLNRLGLFDLPDAGRARFRQILGAFRGTNDLSGRFHVDPATGQVSDMGTSDTSIRGQGRPATQFEQESLLNRSFLDQIADSLGVSRFIETVRGGNTAIKGRDPNTGFLYNLAGDYFDDMGFKVDPATGQRIGYQGNGSDMNALMALLNSAGPAQAFGSLTPGALAPGGPQASGGAVSGGPAGVSGSVGFNPSDPLGGLMQLLQDSGLGQAKDGGDLPFTKTFRQGDPLSALFPELGGSGFQNILEGIGNNPRIRAFNTGGFQVGKNLANLFPPPTQAFKFGAPSMPAVSTDFIAPPPMPELPPVPAPPTVPTAPGGGQAPVHKPPRPWVR